MVSFAPATRPAARVGVLLDSAPMASADAEPPGAAPTLGSARSRIPTELRGEGSWLRRCGRTLVGVLASPRDLFARCPEPVDHGTALRFLATLRLLPWLVLVVWLAVSLLLNPETEPVATRSIHVYVSPAITKALSVWLVLMVPVGMPLLYLVCGLLAHVAVGLTGGASRSVGASMRAVGYAMGPAMLGVAVLDLALYTVGVDAKLYLGVVQGLGLSFLWAAGFGLARTHQVHVLRGFLVALFPTVVLSAVIVGRAILQLEMVPGLPEPDAPYWIP